MGDRPRRLVVTAHHEAGHAWMADGLGVTIKGATIVWRGPILGSVFLDWPNAIDAATRVQRLIPIRLAGPVAESIFLGSPDVRRGNDYKAITMMLEPKYGGEEVRKILYDCEGLVRKAPAHGWVAVSALAATLMEDRTIDGKHAHAVLAAGRPLPFWVAQMEQMTKTR